MGSVRYGFISAGKFISARSSSIQHGKFIHQLFGSEWLSFNPQTEKQGRIFLGVLEIIQSVTQELNVVPKEEYQVFFTNGRTAGITVYNQGRWIALEVRIDLYCFDCFTCFKKKKKTSTKTFWSDFIF